MLNFKFIQKENGYVKIIYLYVTILLYHAFNCPAEVRITRKKRENNQYVTKCNLKHENHQISNELYLHHHSQRKLTEQEAQEAYDMYKINGNVKLIIQTMSAKNVFNIKTCLEPKKEIDRMPNLINDRIKLDNQDNFIFGENMEESKIYSKIYIKYT
ncbi:unnamed protein product [Brachionus calyciflorus]|uniref:Uncharacterized protein n=1 Tax=Brachionus calyciflorus TaxID=104777 RepID=A0A813M4G4_9BILA|nr:unnamed protein product [Brachionus calyciflorus]